MIFFEIVNFGFVFVVYLFKFIEVVFCFGDVLDCDVVFFRRYCEVGCFVSDSVLNRGRNWLVFSGCDF